MRVTSIIAGVALRAVWILRGWIVLLTVGIALVLVPVMLLPAIATPGGGDIWVPAPGPGAPAASTPAPPPTGAGYTLLTSARWPCATIHISYNPAGEPYPASADVAAAVVLLDEAFGLGRVAFDGVSSRVTPDDVEGEPPSRPTTVIGWVPSSAELPEPGDPDALGEGGPVTAGGRVLAATVRIVAASRLVPGMGPGGWGSVILHELGHGVGLLGHVQDPTSQMTPKLSPTRPAGWGRGDLAGLDAAAGSCRAPRSVAAGNVQYRGVPAHAHLVAAGSAR